MNSPHTTRDADISWCTAFPVPAMAIAACLEHGLDHSEVTARSGGGDRAIGFELPLELLAILRTHGGGHPSWRPPSLHVD